MSFIRKFFGDINDKIRRKKNRQYEFRICIMKDGLDSWATIRQDSMTWKYSGGESDLDSYEIEPNCLYELELNPGLRFRHWFKRVKNSFIVIFREGSPDGIVYEDPERSAYTLKVVEESKALGMALRDEFKKAMGWKTIFIVIVLAVVIAVAYWIVTGQVSI